MLVVSNIRVGLEDGDALAIEKARRVLGLGHHDIMSSVIIKKSVDARRRGNITLVCAVGFEVNLDEGAYLQRHQHKDISIRTRPKLELSFGKRKLGCAPVIAGFGPAGMFAGLVLARCGYCPVILERGQAVEQRVKAVEDFWNRGILDTHSNVQFGEGGAGTFSDGKLTTRISDSRCEFVLSELHRFGAPAEILQKAKPHIGTDLLRNVVRAMREEIISLGGKILFESQLTGLSVVNGRLQGIEINGQQHGCEQLILAVGHSARDTFEMLMASGLVVEPKAFSVGVRIEHLQEEINKALYGGLAHHPALPPGEYQLSYRQGNRAVYTFCMCPGGLVVPSASEPGGVVTNGMSEFLRDRVNANSAVAVSILPEDFGNQPLDGIAFQRKLEQAAFSAGGRNYKAPAQTVGNFLSDRVGCSLGSVFPSYSLGVTDAGMAQLLPSYVTELLKTGLRNFDKRLPGFAANDAILTGVETRTSSPVRICRNEQFQAVGIEGIYPCGEGAGYAGGIMSAAVDGIKVAQALMSEFAPLL